MSSVRSRPTPPFVLMVPNRVVSTGKNKFATALSSALPVLYEIVKRRCVRVPLMWFVAVAAQAIAPDRFA